MNKKEKILVIDTETANTLEDPLVYDIGLAVCDRSGAIYEKKSLVIYDIYRGERKLMQSCYYANKIPEYEKQLKNGSSKLVTLLTAQRIVLEIIKKYNIKTIAAYNCAFDLKALNTTMRYITKSRHRYFFPYGLKYMCIWSIACQLIYTQKTFIKWAVKNNYVSPAGNIQTSAEIGYRYYTQNENFREEHKGLQDVEIECYIMAKCFSQHKKVNTGINRLCWKIPSKSDFFKSLFFYFFFLLV